MQTEPAAPTSSSPLRRALRGSRTAQAAYGCAVLGRLGVERWALGWRHPDRARTGRILAYHSVGTPEWKVNDVSPRAFERHLQIATDDGWSFGTPAQVLAAPEKPLLAVTFDDGVASVLHNAAPVLRHHGIPATMFAVTGWADGGHENGYDHVLDWHGLAALQASGISVASHSETHPDFGLIDAAHARRELEVSRLAMQRMLDVPAEEFAIPLGQSNNWSAAADRAARDVGYTTVYAQSVDGRPADTVPRTFITRIDSPRLFRAALAGCYDSWEEWR